MPRTIFNKKYSQSFANERNLVAGILNKDVTPETKNILDDIVFMAVEIKKHEDEIVYENIDSLESWGFNQKYKLEKYWVAYSDFEKAFFKMKEYRETKSPFLLDGFVIKVAEKYRNQFGENSHDPEWAVAIKFAPKDVQTPNETIQWNFGKTGEIIPVGIFAPVDLDGTIVKRASLYNYGFVIKNKVYPGSICTIVKAGDIIPQVIDVVSAGDESKFNAPTHCPHCNSKLVIEDVHLLCKNENCSGIKKAMFHQGVGMLDLFGVGSSMVDDIFASGFTNAIDLLNPTIFNKKSLIAKGIVSEGKVVDNLFSEIEKIKELSLQKVILMLGYQGMGSSTSAQIANLVAGVDYNFAGLQRSIVEGFEPGQPKRLKLDNAIGDLMQFIDVKMPEDSSNKIGLEMTGSPKGAGFDSKESFVDVAKQFGFIHAKLSASKILVTDDLNSTTGKMANAAKMNAKVANSIEVLSYEQFIAKYCKGYTAPVAASVQTTKTAAAAPKTNVKSLF
jgi:NAD-dependent DNA ligase